LATNDTMASIGFSDGRRGSIPMAELAWARHNLERQKLGPALKRPADALQVGDVVAVEPLEDTHAAAKRPFALRQIPNVGGGIVAIVPGQMAIVGFSPRVNDPGNSIRSAKAITHIVNELGLNLFSGE